jgi:hypothetical protein
MKYLHIKYVLLVITINGERIADLIVRDVARA